MEQQQESNGGGTSHAETADERKKRKQREYQRTWYKKRAAIKKAGAKPSAGSIAAKKRWAEGRQASKFASKRVPHKVRVKTRAKKRRGEYVHPARNDKAPKKVANVQVERTTDAIVWLREATMQVCSHCGTKQPRPSRQQLLTMLARNSLEEG